jgi:uncharacterized protein YbjT (DUF2867 family)
MMASILVTGASGNLGRHVVPLLRDRGHELRLLSRRPGQGAEYVVGDTVGGTGLRSAVADVETIVHLAGSSKGDDVGTSNLAEAAREAGVAHLVMISVIGADTMPIGYFRAKHRAEGALAASGVPYTVLRAAQFHDFVGGPFGALLKMPVVPEPRAIRLEPVDVGEVAHRLVELAEAAPAGRVSDLAGPAVLEASYLLRSAAAARCLRRAFAPMPVPGAVGRAYRSGANLTGEGALRGARTWEDYLATRSTVTVAV